MMISISRNIKTFDGNRGTAFCDEPGTKFTMFFVTDEKEIQISYLNLEDDKKSFQMKFKKDDAILLFQRLIAMMNNDVSLL